MSYSSGMNLPPLRGINKKIIIILGATFLLTSIINATGTSVTSILSLSGHMALKGHIYQFLTYPLVSHSLLEVIFSCMIFWFIGDELENIWGKKRYMTFLFSTFFVTGVIYSLIEIVSGSFAPLSGVNGVVSSLCLAYAILFPDRIFSFMMIFPIKAKYFCMILIGMSLYNLFLSPNKFQAIGHLMALAVGFVTMLVMAKAKLPNIGSKISLLDKKKKNHLRLVDDKEKKSPKYWQ